MDKITRMSVTYANGQTDEWTGSGTIDIVTTSVTEEHWVTKDGKEPVLRKEEKPVRYVTAMVSLK